MRDICDCFDDTGDDDDIDLMVQKLRREPGFSNITANNIERIVDAVDDGNYMTLARLVLFPILKAVMPRILIALAVLVVLFYLKWWLGLIGVIPFILYAAWCILAKLNNIAKILDMDILSDITELIDEIFKTNFTSK